MLVSLSFPLNACTQYKTQHQHVHVCAYGMHPYTTTFPLLYKVACFPLTWNSIWSLISFFGEENLCAFFPTPMYCDCQYLFSDRGCTTVIIQHLVGWCVCVCVCIKKFVFLCDLSCLSGYLHLLSASIKYFLECKHQLPFNGWVLLRLGTTFKASERGEPISTHTVFK